MATHGWEAVLTVLSILITVIVGLIAWYLRSIIKSLDTISERIETQDKKIDEQNTKISTLEKAYLLCKQGCQQDFVSAGQFIRNESYNRQKLDAIAESVNKLAGNMKVIEQMPLIAGQIASNIVKQMLNHKEPIQ